MPVLQFKFIISNEVLYVKSYEWIFMNKPRYLFCNYICSRKYEAFLFVLVLS